MTSNSFYESEYHGSMDNVDLAGIYEQWQRDSEAARQNLRCHLDLAYGDANRETIDIFPSETDSTRWLVFIHGGYWRVMTKAHFSFLATPFVRAGWHVAMVEYDLCPAVSMYTIVEQCRRAIGWLVKHAADYGHGCEQMVISGHSAGGHLTGMMFATNWEQYGVDAATITGGIAISGLFDLDPLSQVKMNADLKLDVADVQKLSPARLKPLVDAPLVLTVGERESNEFHRQNYVLKGAPGWGGIASDLIEVAGMHHFNILDDFMDLNGKMWSALAR